MPGPTCSPPSARPGTIHDGLVFVHDHIILVFCLVYDSACSSILFVDISIYSLYSVLWYLMV